MLIETRAYGWLQENPVLLLVLDPKQFFAALRCKPFQAWRNLLSVSLAAAVLYYLTGHGWSNWFSAFVFFLNAVGMTCIFSGCVFIFARSVLRPPCPLGQVFMVCAYASLGPILLSWIPGAVWIIEPWKWWLSAIGLSVCTPAGLGKTGMVIGFALGAMYVLFRILLFIN